MSVMSAAVRGDGEAGGQPAGASPKLSPRGPRMASSVSDPDGTQADAGSPGGRSAQAGSPPRAGHDRRLRLVTTEVHVRKVRVAREVGSRTVRPGGPETGAMWVGEPGVSAPWPGEAGFRAQRASVQQTGVRRVAVPGASAQRVRMQRVRMQRVSVGRVSVQAVAVPAGGLRLTRRGRRVLTGFVMLVIIISAMLIWTSVAGAQAPGAGSAARSPYQGMTQIVVQPGQTLWSVAAAADPSADPWVVIQQISDANALNGAQIQAGQLLWVPRG